MESYTGISYLVYLLPNQRGYTGRSNNNSASDSRGRPVSSRIPSLERSRIRLRRTDLCEWPPGRLAKFLRGLVALRKSP